ncbi:hypothetical protein DFH29DRAFT_977058, partial [Suillus ampliporus]
PLVRCYVLLCSLFLSSAGARLTSSHVFDITSFRLIIKRYHCSSQLLTGYLCSISLGMSSVAVLLKL